MRQRSSFESYTIVAILFLTSVGYQCPAFGSDSTDSPYLIIKRDIPKQYARTYEFLEFIKNPKESIEAFDANKAPHWDISKFLSFLSTNGVTFTDVNGYINGHYVVADIQKALTNRKGQIFVTFAHLADIYSIPYKQYSELSFDPTADGVVTLPLFLGYQPSV